MTKLMCSDNAGCTVARPAESAGMTIETEPSPAQILYRDKSRQLDKNAMKVNDHVVTSAFLFDIVNG